MKREQKIKAEHLNRTFLTLSSRERRYGTFTLLLMYIPAVRTTLFYNVAQLPRVKKNGRSRVRYEVKVHSYHVNVSPPLTLAPSRLNLWSNRRHFLSRSVGATRGQWCIFVFFFPSFFLSRSFIFFFLFSRLRYTIRQRKKKTLRQVKTGNAFVASSQRNEAISPPASRFVLIEVRRK